MIQRLNVAGRGSIIWCVFPPVRCAVPPVRCAVPVVGDVPVPGGYSRVKFCATGGGFGFFT